MSNAKSAKKTVEQMKIFLFGDEEKSNKQLIRDYAGTMDIIEKSDSFEFEKTIKGNAIKLIFYHISSTDDKLTNLVKNSNGAFILFDMSERNSFDNILDKWLIWLREVCKVNDNVFILGDFHLCDDNTNSLFLVTSDDEIQEVIECSEVTASFCKIGGLDIQTKRIKIDELMEKFLKSASQVKFVKEDPGISINKDCIIF